MGPPSAWDGRIASVRKDGMAPLTDASVERWFTTSFAVANPQALAPIREMLVSTDPVGYAGACAAIRDMDMRRTVTLIDVPTLVVGGTLDPATPPPHTQALGNAIAGAQLVWLEAAHLSNVERPAEFSRAVMSHLGG
jgi:3-oxoadipate enol-lactonase